MSFPFLLWMRFCRYQSFCVITDWKPSQKASQSTLYLAIKPIQTTTKKQEEGRLKEEVCTIGMSDKVSFIFGALVLKNYLHIIQPAKVKIHTSKQTVADHRSTVAQNTMNTRKLQELLFRFKKYICTYVYTHTHTHIHTIWTDDGGLA